MQIPAQYQARNLPPDTNNKVLTWVLISGCEASSSWPRTIEQIYQDTMQIHFFLFSTSRYFILPPSPQSSWDGSCAALSIVALLAIAVEGIHYLAGGTQLFTKVQWSVAYEFWIGPCIENLYSTVVSITSLLGILKQISPTQLLMENIDNGSLCLWGLEPSLYDASLSLPSSVSFFCLFFVKPFASGKMLIKELS